MAQKRSQAQIFCLQNGHFWLLTSFVLDRCRWGDNGGCKLAVRGTNGGVGSKPSSGKTGDVSNLTSLGKKGGQRGQRGQVRRIAKGYSSARAISQSDPDLPPGDTDGFS